MKNTDSDTVSGNSGTDTSLKDAPRSTNSMPQASTSGTVPPAISNKTARQKNKSNIHDSQHHLMGSEGASQWIFTEEEVMSAPCIIDGLDPIEERCRRAKGVNFITQAGILLKLPQLTIATASVFFHRYFMRHTMIPERGGAHHYNVAATALFLATKTEENCRKTREVVVAVAKVAQKNPALVIDEQSKEYWKWRDSILFLEEHMLELLTFDLVVSTPHIHLLRCLETLEIEDNKSLRNTAWAFLNDSCMTSLCLMMPASDITIAAIYFAVRLNNETLPDVDNKPWWHCINGDPEKIVKAVCIVDRFWTENPLRKNDRPYGSSPSSQDDLDRTRRRGSDKLSSLSECSDSFIDSVNTPNIQDSLKSHDTSDEFSRNADSIRNDSEKKFLSENESNTKNENPEDKPSSQILGSWDKDISKRSIESNENGDDKELENDASDPNPLESIESQNAQSCDVENDLNSRLSKRRLSDDGLEQLKEKRHRTKHSLEESC